MRLWSIHPELLDRMGLLGLWREALHAQRILIAGPPYKLSYGTHPQMERFKTHSEPLSAIGCYLMEIYWEGTHRGYKFDRSLIHRRERHLYPMTISRGQVNHEIRLLLGKLAKRDKQKYLEVSKTLEYLSGGNGDLPGWSRGVEINSAFSVDNSDMKIASWERVKEN